MKLKKIISINLTFVILLALIPFHALGANVERPDLAKELSDDAGTTDNLPTPSDLYWDGISAKWSGMMDTPPDFERYDFELYYSEFDNKETISLVYSTSWYAIDYVNFVKLSQRIVEDNGSGYYYFRVRAVASNSATTAFSDWSELSPAYHYEMPEHLPTPSGLYWEDGIPKFAELGTTIEGIESYTLCLYYAENESIQPQVLVNCNYNVTNGYLLSYPSPFNSLYENKTTGFYYFTVQLISNDITAALDSAVSALSEAYYYEAPVKYPAPVGPYWDGAYMNWNDINPDGGTYEVEVYYGESAETSIDQLQFVSRDSNIFLEDWTSWPGLRQNHVCRFGEGYYFFRVKVRYIESVGIVEGEWSEFSNAYYYDGTEGAQLPSPTNLSWEGQNISWDGLKNPAAKHISYEVKYYFGTREDGTDAHSLPIIDRTYRPGYNGVIEYPFDICASYGLNEGYHFFKVKVLSSNVTIATDSDWSELSPAFELTAKENIAIDETNFPDARFRTFVSQFDLNGDKHLSYTERKAVTTIKYPGDMETHSLKGIEYFTSLTRLECSWNCLTELDLSSNPDLVYLDCSCNELVKLDISNCTELSELHCYYNHLKSLDVSNNKKLTVFNCDNNRLGELDVSSNTALTHLSCCGSIFRDPESTTNHIEVLDVTRNHALVYLNCSYNLLNTLDVSNNLLLAELYCERNQLTALDTHNNTRLTQLDCSNNQISRLDISKNENLKTLCCGGNPLTGLDTTSNAKLEKLMCDVTQLTELDVRCNVSLKSLDCSRNQLTQLDVSYNVALESLSCSDNQLTQLDVSHNVALESLWCHDNQLTQLDVSHNVALESLSCSRNQLTQLDVSYNVALESLSCSDNQLAQLDVSHNVALESLDCYANQLTELDVHNNTALVILYCGDSLLTELDVHNNTALSVLECSNSQLNMLDVSRNLALECLWCDANQLTELDVSNNVLLFSLTCEENQLYELDVGSNTELTDLWCGNNQLTALDLSNNSKEFQAFYCLENHYNIVIPAGRTFDLSKLPGKFDVTKAYDWIGGTVNGSTLTVDKNVETVTYRYDCGNGLSAVFYLDIKYPYNANDSSNSFNTSFPLPDAPAAETTYHDDGSLTTIVTDKATGSIIETTQYPNGVQAKTTTDAAGNITSDITVPAGVIAEVVIPSKNVTPGTVAVLLLSDGTEKVISTSVPVTDGIAVTLENTATLRLLDNALPYEDVAEDAWYTDAAAFVSARRIMTGTGEDIFEPQATATRAMIWTILSRLNGFDTSSEEPWYSAACNWAMEAGISDGSDANGEITREQLVTMLWRYSGIPQIDADLSNHPDQDKVSSYALDAMRWAVASGIIQGNENGLITPDSTATRAEIAQIIMNFLTMTR